MLSGAPTALLVAALLAAISGSRSAPVAFGALQREAMSVLVKFKFLSNEFPSDVELREAVAAFQRSAGLAVTSTLDAATVRVARQSHCSRAEGGRGALASYSLAANGWGRHRITYRLTVPSSREVTLRIAERSVDRAFKMWEAVANIEFVKLSGYSILENSDINIGFFRGYHGDVEPFQGRFGKLAHAFYPPNGDIHFNDDKQFSDTMGTSSSMLITAAHEIGHAIGIKHSDDPRSVMFPVIGLHTDNFRLSQDDVEAVQIWYGSANNATACSSGPCVNGAYCHDQGSRTNFLCTCQTYYYGDRCQHRSLPQCTLPCYNSGVCSLTAHGYSCICPHNFYGVQCQFPYSWPCQGNPCRNYATCINLNINYYHCQCTAGFTGTNCDVVALLETGCLSKPCFNGGICVKLSGDGSYVCSCPAPYIGVQCERRRSGPVSGIPRWYTKLAAFATTQSWPNHRLQTDSVFRSVTPRPRLAATSRIIPVLMTSQHIFSQRFVTQSYAYFTTRPPEHSRCSSSPCHNHSTCQPIGFSGVRCLCHSGYYGQRCQYFSSQWLK